MSKILLILFLISKISFGILGWKGNTHNADGYSSEALTKMLTQDLPDPLAVVNANGRTIINLSSDTLVAINRDWTFECPLTTHLVVVYFTGTGAARLQNGVALNGACGGTVILSGPWTAVVSGTRLFVSDGTNYLEVPN